MASIWRHPKSKFWYARFARPDGTYTNRSTKKTDRTEAKKVAQAYEDVARRRSSEAQVRRVMSDLFQQMSGSPIASENIDDYFNRWLGRKAVEAEPRTVEKYRNVVQRFLAWQGPQANRDLGYLSVSEIAAFRDSVAKRVRAATVNVYLKCLRTALQDAWREGLIIENPAAKVDAIKRKDSFERRPFTLAELKILVGVATGEWRGIILCGLYTGARLTDVAGLTWQNVDLDRNEIRFVTAKTGRRQILPIAKPLRQWIEDLEATDDPKQPLFPASAKCTASALSKQFYGVLEAAALVPKRDRDTVGTGRDVRRDYSEVSFHSLRHTATSLLKNAGVSDVVAREIIGHDTAAASRVYSHLEQDTLKEALDKMPDLVSPRKSAKKPKKGTRSNRKEITLRSRGSHPPEK